MWYKIQAQMLHLQILAKPNAKKTALIKIDEQGMSITIHAHPQKDAANKELILFLAKTFSVPKSKIMIKTGKTSKYKLLVLPLTENVEKILNELEKSFFLAQK